MVSGSLLRSTAAAIVFGFARHSFYYCCAPFDESFSTLTFMLGL
jgi:hypothetical protein